MMPNDLMYFLYSRKHRTALKIGFFFLLSILFFAMRIQHLYSGYWEDEIHHNYLTVLAPDMTRFWNWLILQMQPPFEYFLRRYVFFNKEFPLFPINEISF